MRLRSPSLFRSLAVPSGYVRLLISLFFCIALKRSGSGTIIAASSFNPPDNYMSRQAFQDRCQSLYQRFPWTIRIIDPQDHEFTIGQEQPHWYDKPLIIHLKTTEAAKDFVKLNAFALVEKYLRGEVDLEGNFYILADIKDYLPVRLTLLQYLRAQLSNHAFQSIPRAATNVKSHYDISQNILDVYLDKRYQAYSCAMFEYPTLSNAAIPTLCMAGDGEPDAYDSLEKAQWRKFKDAVDFLAPAERDHLLDVGCGYAGQLEVGLQHHNPGRFVGWTHSANQVREGKQRLQHFKSHQWELNEGDYRQDKRIYDHICSTGMISHVGPRGLVPYVRNIRSRIKQGGRYLHHALMADHSSTPLNRQVGIAFNKQYVWPGFHWFTLGDHIKALETNGFKIMGVTNLRAQYSKTICAWYERMMQQRNWMQSQMGEATFRAWRLYLGGGAGSRAGDVNRLYCVAI